MSRRSSYRVNQAVRFGQLLYGISHYLSQIYTNSALKNWQLSTNKSPYLRNCARQGPLLITDQ